MRIAQRNREAVALSLIQGALAYEWIDAGVDKLTEKGYIASMPGTIGAFAGKNPNTGFAGFLTGTVLPHAAGFGYLVEYGETLAGIGLAVAAVALLLKTTRPIYHAALGLTALSALGAVVMNFCYWQAAGWMSVSTDGINIVMGLVALVLLGTALVALLPTQRHKHDAFETLNRTGVTVEEPRPLVAHR